MSPEDDPKSASRSAEVERLADLIEFAKESARLRTKPASQVSQHGLFARYEEDIQGRPGIVLNQGSEDGGDEVWLEVERLHETKPPLCEMALLNPWIALSQGPDVEPGLRTTTTGEALIEAGTHRDANRRPANDKERQMPAVEPSAAMPLTDYDRADDVRAQLALYVANVWRPWAEEERRRRWTIRLYGDLFTLKQRLEGSIVESQIELVWGVGIGIWNNRAGSAAYPLITRPVELTLNVITQGIEVRPRDVDAKLEVDWYASIDNPGVQEVEKAAKDFFGKSSVTFSPFDRGSFEPLLKAAVTHLDPNGVYWPNEVPAEDRKRPKSEQNLRVTDTWVLFARPRSNSVLIQDLVSLKAQVEAQKDAEQLPRAVAAFVKEPSGLSEAVELPLFRGVSANYSNASETFETGEAQAQDLYFPKPFNDEQLRIVQLLEKYDGVVVQGPPGTGKTHTIANVICHYLANGNRVLVTSMKDHALGVLQEQLPEEIRPLAISLLTSESEGLKQFEFAIQKIATEVQALDRTAYRREIQHLEDQINALHGKLVHVDRTVATWARSNLEKIRLGEDEISPEDAAREVVEHADVHEWMFDPLGIGAEFEPQFTDADVTALRAARRELGEDMAYLGKSLPQLIEFPDAKRLLTVHQDLSQFTLLAREVERGSVPSLADSGQETLAGAQALLSDVEHLRKLRDEVMGAHRPWCVGLRDAFRAGSAQKLIGMLESLGGELRKVNEERKIALARPVAIPPGAEQDTLFAEAVSNLAAGKSAFGLGGLFGKGEQKKMLGQITLVGKAPQGTDDWAEVGRHLDLQHHLRELAVRWNALASELKLDTVSDKEPAGGVAAAELYDLCLKVKEVVLVERRVVASARKVFPGWTRASMVDTNEAALHDLDQALRHHLTKNRLADVWAVKETFQKVLTERSGTIVEELRAFLGKTLGNPEVPDADMQAKWSALMTELARALGLGPQLLTITDVTAKIEHSGAPLLATTLRKPLTSATDPYLPDSWRQAWRLRRLATHLQAIDAQEELKKLAATRADIERDLANAYRQTVVKRTWLRLAENASPSIRSALQAYLNAIQKIGKGTGKRAVRYRQDARNSARQANPAVPCWIMPHYRVSESLPAELGCFDLVVIDEASQSDLTALPALLRGKKLLIVGDNKQVSPEGVGLEEEKVRSLMTRFLGNQVETYRSMMSPERSIYDLCRVVFAQSGFMLKEHFRCVAPIIEYSKREFYDHELRPLRVPRFSERLDPPLVDVYVEDGFRTGDTNTGEAQFIVEEFGRLINDPRMQGRSIGIVSLIGSEQALFVWTRLTEEYGPDVLERFKVDCGDARTFQGKEKCVMFLSMVQAPNYPGAVLSRDTFAQRFNVAASRAKDRMYLVRSVQADDLSVKDVLRRNLISHFSAPFHQDEVRVADLRMLCESPFEREVYDILTGKGYWVTPQLRVGQYRIDMVVEGHNDARLAVECDGDKYHGPEKWGDDMQRQRVLERAGWVFWRCFASTFVRRRKAMVEELLKTLEVRGIEPIGAEHAPQSVHTEQRVFSASAKPASEEAPGDRPAALGAIQDS
ncbi:MAG: hypothetical protein KF776_15185 [Burkholderiales bacterium]|nr:hypothetical protein [Burkholderiales bacterium]